MTPDEIKQAIAEALAAERADSARREAALRKEIDEAKKLVSAPKPKPSDDDDDVDLGAEPVVEPKPAKGKTDPAAAALARQIEAMKREMAEAKAAAEAERQKLRIAERNAAIRSALADSGIEPTRIDLAFRTITHPDEPLVTDLGENGWGRKVTDKYGNETVQPIADAVKAWADTDHGKAFKPAPTAAGSGSKAPAQIKVGPDGKIDTSALRDTAMSRIAAALNNL